MSLIIEVPTTIEALKAAWRCHVDSDLVDRKSRVLGAIGRIGGERRTGSGDDRQCGKNESGDFRIHDVPLWLRNFRAKFYGPERD